MDPVVLIGFWSAAFLISHFVLSSDPIRSRIVAAVGDRPFLGIYSAVALATFIPMCLEFALHKHAGAMLWYLRDVPALRFLVSLIMLAALILLTAGLMTPSPAGMAPVKKFEPRAELKLTRHPAFVAFSLFGLAHNADERMDRRLALLRQLSDPWNPRRNASGRPQETDAR